MMRLTALALIVAAFLIGCSGDLSGLWATGTPPPPTAQRFGPAGDGGLFSEKPCGPPCFMNIVPGKTSEAEAIQLMAQLGVYSSCQAFNNEKDGGGRGVTCGDDILWSYQTGSNVVDVVGYSPSVRITVKQIVDHYGAPDIGWVVTTGTAEPYYTDMILLYDKFQMRINLPDQPGLTFHLSPDLPIGSVGLFSQTAYDEFRQPPGLLVPWNGYGDYQEPLIH